MKATCWGMQQCCAGVYHRVGGIGLGCCIPYSDTCASQFMMWHSSFMSPARHVLACDTPPEGGWHATLQPEGGDARMRVRVWPKKMPDPGPDPFWCVCRRREGGAGQCQGAYVPIRGTVRVRQCQGACGPARGVLCNHGAHALSHESEPSQYQVAAGVVDHNVTDLNSPDYCGRCPEGVEDRVRVRVRDRVSVRVRS